MRRAVLILPLLLAADWDRFRGPNGSGVSDDKEIPTALNAGTIRWKAELPGGGHSSPIAMVVAALCWRETRCTCSRRLVASA